MISDVRANEKHHHRSCNYPLWRGVLRGRGSHKRVTKLGFFAGAGRDRNESGTGIAVFRLTHKNGIIEERGLASRASRRLSFAVAGEDEYTLHAGLANGKAGDAGKAALMARRAPELERWASVEISENVTDEKGIG